MVTAKRNAVDTTKNFEFNEKRVAEAYEKTIAKGGKLTDDVASKNFIYYLAHQCPLVQGNSVYEARSLYALINPNEMYDDDQLCDGMFKKEREESVSTDDIQVDISLRPNPSKTYATWFYNLNENQTAVLTVTNELGAVVYNSVLPTSQFSFTVYVNQFASGIYNYNFMVDGKTMKRDKFIVMK